MDEKKRVSFSGRAPVRWREAPSKICLSRSSRRDAPLKHPRKQPPLGRAIGKDPRLPPQVFKADHSRPDSMDCIDRAATSL